MGDKVIYVDSTGQRFPAEIVGPLAEISKAHVNENGETVKGSAKIVQGVNDIIDSYGQKVKIKFQTLRVNFSGFEVGKAPRYADVQASLRSDLISAHRKGYYEYPAVTTAEAPKGDAKKEAPKGDAKK